MKRKLKQSGLSLVETVVVLATVASLAVLSGPAIRSFTNSLGSPGSVRALIGAGLSSARAIAAKEQRYAGIRFQEDINGDQYMIFIINDPAIMASGFKVVKGTKPIKLPERLGVMDFTIVTGHNRQNPVNPDLEFRLDPLQLPAYNDALIDDDIVELSDMTSFSIIFSPSGKLVTRGVRVRNRNGRTDDSSPDDIFNTFTNVHGNNTGMFYQDDYFTTSGNQDLGLGPEPSRRSFVIYDKAEFNKADKAQRWSQYLYTLEMTYINPYTGTIISTNR